MSALGQKQTCAAQKGMSALPPIATAKADFRKRSCPLYPRKRTLVSALFGNLGAASSIRVCAGSRQTSNKIMQKGLAFSRTQSGTVSSSEAWLHFGILPRRLVRRGGASVVAAMVAAQPKEIPMTKATSRRNDASRANDSKIKTLQPVQSGFRDHRDQLERAAFLWLARQDRC